MKLPQIIGYVKRFDSNKTVPFEVNDNRLKDFLLNKRLEKV